MADLAMVCSEQNITLAQHISERGVGMVNSAD